MNRNSGFTLMEAAVALFAIAILASLLVPLASALMSSSRATADYSELQTVYNGIVGNPSQGTYGYLGDVGDYPTTLTDLITPSVTNGWNGPYVNGARTNSLGQFLDPYGGVVEYAEATSSGSDLLALISKGPDLTSTNPNPSSNAKMTSAFPWSAGYNSGSNTDNVLYPNINDSPGQAYYQALGTLTYDLYQFDSNSKVNTTVPGCPAAYQITISSTTRGANPSNTNSIDKVSFRYNPGGASIDLTQGLWGVSILSEVTSATVFNEQVAVRPGASTTRTVSLPPIDSSASPSKTFGLSVTTSGLAGATVDVYSNFSTTAALSNVTSGTVAVQPCAPIVIKNHATNAVLDSFIMPWNNYARLVNASGLTNVTITDTGAAHSNLLYYVYDSGAGSGTNYLLIGTITNKGNKTTKTFYNLQIGDTLFFVNQLNQSSTCTVASPMGACSP